MTRRDFATASATTLAGLLTARISFGAEAQNTGRAPSAGTALIEDLVAANHILADQGIVDGYGHVSVRHDRDPNRYLLSRDLAPALVAAEDVMEYDLDSNPIDRKGRGMYQERFIHGEIYKARPDVKAVVHNHSTNVIPFSVSSIRLQPVFHTAAFIVDGIPVFDASRFSGRHHAIVSNSESGRELARMLGNKSAALILGHGAAVVGTSLPMAVGRSIYLDMSAKIQGQAIALGGKVTALDPAAAREVSQNEYGRAWELWKKRVNTK